MDPGNLSHSDNCCLLDEPANPEQKPRNFVGVIKFLFTK